MSPDHYSSSIRQTSTPLGLISPHRKIDQKTQRNTATNAADRNEVVFGLLYRPDCTKRKEHNQSPSTSHHRHSSCTTVETKASSVIDENPKSECKYEKIKSLNNRIQTAKYFDNLVALLDEAARGLE